MEVKTVLVFFFQLCGFRECPYALHGRSLKILNGVGESPRSQKLQTKGLTGISGVVGDSNQNTLHEGGGYTRVFFQKVIFSISGKLKKSQEEKN